MSTPKRATAFIAAAGLLAIGSVASGQTATPTQADFDRCNRQAQASLSPATPSASPATSAPTVTAPAPGGGSASTPAPPVSAPSPSSMPSASSTSDPTLRGMASAGLSDPAYQLAYRNCLAGR